jgi:O-antigen/teichoic acid export membrane protein
MSDIRDKKLAVNRACQLGAKVVSAVTVFLAVPLVIGALGEVNYGVWATITSILGLLIWADLGLGSGLISRLTAAYAKDDPKAAAESYVTTLGILASFSFILICAGIFVCNSINWENFLSVDSSAAHSAKNSAILLVVLFSVSIPLSLVDRVRMACQENYYTSFAQVSSAILTLLFYWICYKKSLGIEWFVASMLGPALLLNLVNSVLLYKKAPWMIPSLRMIKMDLVRPLLCAGGFFLVLYSLYSIIHSLDTFIIAKFFGASEVAVYSAHARLGTVINTLAMIVAAPLWGAVGDAHSRRDPAWMRQCLQKSGLWILAIIAAVSIFLLSSLDLIFSIWLNGEIESSLMVMGALLLWNSLVVLNALASIFMNAIGEVKTQVLWGAITLPVVFLLKYFLAARVGVIAMLFGGCFVYASLSVVPLWIYINNFFKKESVAF